MLELQVIVEFVYAGYQLPVDGSPDMHPPAIPEG
jgi:hypothetical protein